MKTSEDPWVVLGLSMDADEETIRKAYLEKVKEHPPDRDAVEFERVRDAYALLRDPRLRLKQMLFFVNPQAPLAALVREESNDRNFVGPQPWLDVLRKH